MNGRHDDSDVMDNVVSPSSGPATVSIKARKGQPANLLIQISEDEEGSSSMSSVFTLCNSAIGAGVLSLPYAFRKSGENLIALTQPEMCSTAPTSPTDSHLCSVHIVLYHLSLSGVFA